MKARRESGTGNGLLAPGYATSKCVVLYALLEGVQPKRSSSDMSSVSKLVKIAEQVQSKVSVCVSAAFNSQLSLCT